MKIRLTITRLVIRQVQNSIEDGRDLLMVPICYDPYCNSEKQANN